MAGRLHTVLITPIIDLLGEIFGIKSMAQQPIVMPHFFGGIDFHKQCRQYVEYTIPIFLFKQHRQGVRPCSVIAVILRFIGKEPGHCFTKFFTYVLFILFMGFLNKGGNNLFIHNIYIAGGIYFCNVEIVFFTFIAEYAAGLVVFQNIYGESVGVECTFVSQQIGY